MKTYYKNKVSIGFLCGLFGYTRQAYYKQLIFNEQKRFETALVVDLVKEERKIAKRIGGKKLFRILSPSFEKHGIKLGRDAFFDILRANELLVKPKKRYRITTNSKHYLRKYDNLVVDVQVSAPEQVWVSDITYIDVQGSHAYLILITDAYSKQVMGYHFAQKMDTAFCLVALRAALAQRQYPHQALIHHSDRGLQYCSFAYTEELTRNNISISMTQNGDPYENALAERMNRTFKSEFDIGRTFDSFEQAKVEIEKAITYYNTVLPHLSCDLLTPKQAHQCKGALKKHW